MSSFEEEYFDAFRRITSDWTTVLRPHHVQLWLQDRAALDHRAVKRANGARVNQYRLRKEPARPEQTKHEQ